MYYHQLLASIPTGCLPTTSDNISEAKTRSSNKACENISGVDARRKTKLVILRNISGAVTGSPSKACIATQYKAKRETLKNIKKGGRNRARARKTEVSYVKFYFYDG